MDPVVVLGAQVQRGELTVFELGGQPGIARQQRGGAVGVALGLEYLVESKDNFDNSGIDVKYDELSLRLDYRF